MVIDFLDGLPDLRLESSTDELVTCELIRRAIKQACWVDAKRTFVSEVKKKVCAELYGTHTAGYSKLEQYLKLLCLDNPGATCIHCILYHSILCRLS